MPSGRSSCSRRSRRPRARLGPAPQRRRQGHLRRCSPRRGRRRRGVRHHAPRTAGRSGPQPQPPGSDLPDGGLAGEHDRVRAVEHRVGHVARLRPGRSRRGEHRLEHLGRDDRGDPPIQGAPDELLLDDRHLLIRQLHAHVAAGDHHGIRLLEDPVEGVDRGPRLDLGNDRWRVPSEQRSQQADVVGLPDERLRDDVGTKLQGPRNIRSILGRQRWRRDPLRGDADAGARSDRPAPDDHGRNHVADRFDPQLCGPVRQAGFDRRAGRPSRAGRTSPRRRSRLPLVVPSSRAA